MCISPFLSVFIALLALKAPVHQTDMAAGQSLARLQTMTQQSLFAQSCNGDPRLFRPQIHIKCRTFVEIASAYVHKKRFPQEQTFL